MQSETRADTRLRYRFATLSQARAHVRETGGRPLFFFRQEKLRLLPRSPVCLELCFEDGETNRLLHGVAIASVERRGTWIELLDTRAMRELAPTEYTRRAPRMGTDVLVEIRAAGHVVTGRMLEVSKGGARIRGMLGLGENEHVEVRLLSPDRLTYRTLSGAFVCWTAGGEVGVRFDRLDSASRNAVTGFVQETEAEWKRALVSLHPKGCCGARGVLDPSPPGHEHALADAAGA